ncbi:MAG: hypothetical protein HRU28_06055 [Rhizobiales bacterium]|nr:hypothetical protein [Hyphomicrobiales bacterium]
MQKTQIIKQVAMLSVAFVLASCSTLSAREESNLALAKWQGKKINDFFFVYGKGEFQAKSSQGIKAYFWKSPTRRVRTQGNSYIVKVADPIFPGQFRDKIITQATQDRFYQCKLRIETSSKGTIKNLVNVTGSNECVRHFSLPIAERKAIINARKAAY